MGFLLFLFAKIFFFEKNQCYGDKGIYILPDHLTLI